MRVTVETTYDMSKALGVDKFEVEDVRTVQDVIDKAKAKIGPEFEKLVRLAGIAINGQMVNYRKGLKSPLADGDVVGFVKASAGG